MFNKATLSTIQVVEEVTDFSRGKFPFDLLRFPFSPCKKKRKFIFQS